MPGNARQVPAMSPSKFKGPKVSRVRLFSDVYSVQLESIPHIAHRAMFCRGHRETTRHFATLLYCGDPLNVARG